MRLLVNAANGTVGNSFECATSASAYTDTNFTGFLSGTLGAGGNVVWEVSPDAMVGGANGPGVADASSRWFTIITFNQLGFFTTKDVFRKMRARVTAGDGTTSLTLEVV
jgi:hypothetical protein